MNYELINYELIIDNENIYNNIINEWNNIEFSKIDIELIYKMQSLKNEMRNFIINNSSYNTNYDIKIKIYEINYIPIVLFDYECDLIDLFLYINC